MEKAYHAGREMPKGVEKVTQTKNGESAAKTNSPIILDKFTV